MRRFAAGVTGMIAAVLLGGPLVVLALAAVFDVGADGRPRASAFAIALAASDPSTRRVVRNSLILAATTAAGALFLGVLIGRAASGPRFRGQRSLAILCRLAGVMPPWFAALGLLILSRNAPGWLEIAAPWPLLFGSELIWGVSRVGRAVARARDRLPPDWDDAAQLAGASPRRRWRTVAWPLIRPSAARAAAEVFAVVLLDPGAPLVLGARRTIAYQAVQAAVASDGLPRAAVLGCVAVVLVWIGRGLLRAWGGVDWPLPALSGPGRVPRDSTRSSLLRAAILIAVAVLALIPTVGLVAEVARSGREATHRPDLPLILGHGLALAAVAGGCATLAAALLNRSAAGRRAASAARSTPSLIYGLAMLAVPLLLSAAAKILADRGLPPQVAEFLLLLARNLNPSIAPWPVLIAAVVLARLPEAIRHLGQATQPPDRELIDVARTLGASRPAARSFTTSARNGRLARLVATSMALALTDLGPMVVLVPTLTARPIPIAVLDLAANSPGGPACAAILSLIALLFCGLREISGDRSPPEPR